MWAEARGAAAARKTNRMNVVAAESAIRSSSMARNASWLWPAREWACVAGRLFVILARLLGPIQYGVLCRSLCIANLVAQYSALGTGTVFLRYVPRSFRLRGYWGNILVVTSVVGGALVVALDLLGSRY